MLTLLKLQIFLLKTNQKNTQYFEVIMLGDDDDDDDDVAVCRTVLDKWELT